MNGLRLMYVQKAWTRWPQWLTLVVRDVELHVFHSINLVVLTATVLATSSRSEVYTGLTGSHIGVPCTMTLISPKLVKRMASSDLNWNVLYYVVHDAVAEPSNPRLNVSEVAAAFTVITKEVRMLSQAYAATGIMLEDGIHTCNQPLTCRYRQRMWQMQLSANDASRITSHRQ